MRKAYLALWFFAVANCSFASDPEESLWSKSVDGLQARIGMKETNIVNGTRIVSAYLTLRNVSDIGNPMRVEFESSKLSVRVVDEMGKELPRPIRVSYSGGRNISVDLVLPWDSSLTFNVTQSGLGIPKGKAALLDFGPQDCWIVDVPDGKKYYLVATLKVAETKKKTEERYWHGTISIPQAEIPLKSLGTAPFQKWTVDVASLSAEQQLPAVARKLQELNPGFDGKLTHKIENGIVSELQFFTENVSDISPIRALAGLKSLKCGRQSGNGRTKLVDLSPLQGLPLQKLDCTGTQVLDLSPLKGMPLTHLYFGHTRVTELSPLQGMNLKSMGFTVTAVSDLSPLRGMQSLWELDCTLTKVSDLSSLKGFPLQVLRCGGTAIDDLSPLRGMPLEVLDCYNTKVADLSPLKDTPLRSLNCSGTSVRDLSSLKGMNLRDLNCGANHITDLFPLKGMSLEVLNCYGSTVADLSPLKGLPLTYLDCAHTKVSDLSPLQGMPLKVLMCHETGITSLSPLKGMDLMYISIAPKTIVEGLEVVREMKHLTKIEELSFDDFCKKYDAGEFGKPKPEPK